MALCEVDFVSKALGGKVTFSAVIPAESEDMSGKPDSYGTEPIPTIYLLHGSFGDHTDFICNTRAQLWAQEHGVALIMPSGGNDFYVDKPYYGGKWGTFVGQELVDFTRRLFPLSCRREDTCIAGISMGGYGALVNGLRFAETFGSIGALSPGILNDAVCSQDAVFQAVGFDMPFYRRYFDGPERLHGTDRDWHYLADLLAQKGQAAPDVYLAVGRDDFLHDSVQDLRGELEARGIDVSCSEGSGGHEWGFWDSQLELLIAWVKERSAQSAE